MRFTRQPALIAVLAMMFSTLACEVSATTANIADAWMSTMTTGPTARPSTPRMRPSLRRPTCVTRR
jgi:hypothetical protein